NRQVGPELSRVHFEQRLAAAHGLTGRYENLRDHTGQRGPNRNVLGAGFDEADGGYRVGEISDRRRLWWRRRDPARLRPGDGICRPECSDEGERWKDKALHA